VLKNNIGFIYGVDINKTMIEKAEGKIKKTSKNSSNVTFVHASILEYPFQENFCHAILVNQIIHHLETEKTVDSYTNTKLMFKEAYRILQPNGLLIMNISTHEQWYDGFWFYELLPGARDKLIKRHASMDSLIAFAKEAKLELKSIYTPVSEILQSSSYFNPTGPLEKVFRDGDSTWALASEQELASALNFIETKAKNGTLQAYFEKRDALRKRIGQTTFLVFRKP
jgi:SAM-dependent methyltransferase